MADIKWIKLTTDMFDNRKIKHLRKLPEGNNIVLIWVMLLTMAGRCNAGGLIFLTENIPYTPKMLADELGFEENTVQLALTALEQFNMIVTEEGFFTVAGWEEYQNIEGLDKIREQNRIRKQNQRMRQRLALEESHVKSRDSHATEEDKEKDRDIDKKKVSKKAKSESFDSIIDSYTQAEDLRNAILEFVKMRQRIKKPMTNYALTLMLKKLDKLANNADMKIDILNQSIVNGWQDVYPLKKADQRQRSNDDRFYGRSPSEEIGASFNFDFE